MVKSNKKGLSLIILVFMVLTISTAVVIAYAFLITNEMKSGGIELNEQRALYIAETGIERAMEFLEDDTDWSDNDGTAVISEDFGAGSYSVDLSSGTRTNIIVESEATVDSGPRKVTRKIRQKIRRLPEAFNYALFWEGTGTAGVNQGDVDVNGGDVFTKGAIASIDTGTFDVVGGGTPSVTSGGLVYTTDSWTASGTYTEGAKPGDEPSYPTLDTTFYDDEIATAGAHVAGDLTWVGGSHVLSGTTYVNGAITITGTAVTGSGALVATGDILVNGASNITPGNGGFIRLISATNVTIEGTTTTATGTLAYARGIVTVNGVTATGAFVSSDEVSLTGSAVVTGYIYADALALRENSTTNGSVVTNSFSGNRISNPNKVVTINYDQSYLEEAIPGLGLDIDGDANEEGIIIKVPGTWEQL